MLIDFEALQSTATQFIKAMGRSAALHPIEGGGADIPVTAIMSNYGDQGSDPLMFFDDRRALIAPGEGIAPDPEKHRLVINGKLFRIVNVRTVCPSTTVLYYDCKVRQVSK